MFILSKNKLVIKKYKALGWREFENVKYIDNIIYIDDASIFSEKTFDFLKNKVTTIIFNRGGKDVTRRPFNFIDKNKLNIIEREDFILVDRDEIEKEKSRADILYKIIEEYKEDRKSNLLNNPS